MFNPDAIVITDLVTQGAALVQSMVSSAFTVLTSNPYMTALLSVSLVAIGIGLFNAFKSIAR